MLLCRLGHARGQGSSQQRAFTSNLPTSHSASSLPFGTDDLVVYDADDMEPAQPQAAGLMRGQQGAAGSSARAGAGSSAVTSAAAGGSNSTPPLLCEPHRQLWARQKLTSVLMVNLVGGTDTYYRLTGILVGGWH
jgi:hypothetical protein